MEEKENKSLVEKKESIFDKIISFFKSIFKKEKVEVNETVEAIETEEPKQTREESFLNSLKVDLNSVSDIAKLKQRFEDGEIKIDDISDEDLKKLNNFYDRQNDDLRREIDQKKIKIGMLKVKLMKASN